MKLTEFIELGMQVEFNFDKTESGNCRIDCTEYPVGSNLAIVPSNYQSMLAGNEYTVIKLEKPFKLYRLYDGNEVIMLNSGIEISNQYTPYVKAHGNVLIGGLGIGLLPKLLCEKENVTKVTSVEFNPDVVELCKVEHEKAVNLTADFYEYIKTTDLNQFDYIYIDIYTDTTKADNYGEIIIPLRKYLLENYPTVPFDFWQEDQWKALHLLRKLNKG